MSSIQLQQLPQQITTTTHIFFAIACACFAWLLFVKPAMTLLPKPYTIMLICFTLFIYCIIIPAFMLSDETYKLNIYGEDEFRLVKLLSIVFAILIVQFCLFSAYYNVMSLKTLTYITIFILVINMLEAAVVSIKNIDKPDFDGITEFPQMNLILAITAIVLVCIKLKAVFMGSRMSYTIKNNELQLQSNLGLFFILAYTFWNFGFKIQQIESPLVLMYFTVSLLLPLVVYILDVSDWLQVRALTLLFAIIVETGFTNDYPIFPYYNKLGYNELQTKEDPISIFFSNAYFKMFLSIFGLIFAIIDLFLEW